MKAERPVVKGLGYPQSTNEPVPSLMIFVLLVSDGMTAQEAYRRAGFKGKSLAEPDRLWRSKPCQEAFQAIAKARAQTGAITLPDATYMLQRVFAAAMQASDFGPAHNAAFSLARLYGLVVDRATITDLRRPSRDPDAPAEQALEGWVASLPSLPSPGASSPAETPRDGCLAARAPAPEPRASSLSPQQPIENTKEKPQGSSLGPLFEPSAEPSDYHQGSSLDGKFSNDFNDLARLEPWAGRGGEFENGAPAEAVTGTPTTGGRGARASPKVIEHDPSPPIRKRAPRPKKQVPARKGVKKRKLKPRIPSAKELFG